MEAPKNFWMAASALTLADESNGYRRGAADCVLWRIRGATRQRVSIGHSARPIDQFGVKRLLASGPPTSQVQSLGGRAMLSGVMIKVGGTKEVT